MQDFLTLLKAVILLKSKRWSFLFKRVLAMRLLTVKEVAQMLGIAATTVYAWTAKGKSVLFGFLARR